MIFLMNRYMSGYSGCRVPFESLDMRVWCSFTNGRANSHSIFASSSSAGIRDSSVRSRPGSVLINAGRK